MLLSMARVESGRSFFCSSKGPAISPAAATRLCLNHQSEIGNLQIPGFGSRFSRKSRSGSTRKIPTRIHSDVARDLETASYFLGKGIILFTMFFCSLNYFFYRHQRELYERNQKDDDS